ncbi:MAG TPA: MvdC family ATP-grasp ribosomal peptide maturase [Blastocatellia bacterium]|nr:MvdC family ATP-grasp ribosomal peptide maturase [Blastocatellia bacterium]
MPKKSPRDAVLLLTHTGDFFTIDRVAEAIARRGARPFRFDTDSFPLEAKLSARLEPDGLGHFISYLGEELDSGRVRAVWARKMWSPRMDESLDPQYHQMCMRESSVMLRGFLDGLFDVRWVNHPDRDHEAENKLRQLRLARDAGLSIPRTLNTNDPARVREFFDEVGGSMVAKLLRPLSTSMGAAPYFVYTSEVREEDLDDAGLLRHCPMLFQEKIEKEFELRVAYVDGEFFAGAIDAKDSGKGQVDWRLSEPGECLWTRGEVPSGVAAALRALMSRLGLVYGAIDLIMTPRGEHVFLEVNPGGEWGMLERDLDLPISDAIARALLK